MIAKSSRRKREWSGVLALMVVGAGLRLWALDRLGLQHFDEGIYALAGLWSVLPGGIDPSSIAYAPPGFPILIGLAYRLAFPWPGVSDLAAIAPSIVCGIVAILVAAWIGRRTFGPGAGFAAAAFAAISGPHVAFSRMALTDVPFLLTWLVAIALGARFLERPGFARSLAMGLAVGLSQYFKYNGWLVGAIIALAAIVGLLVDPKKRQAGAIARTFGWGLLAAFLAALVYLPWFLYVEDHGGYANLLAHHRSYLGGFDAWWPHWRLQMAQSVALAGLVSGEMTWPGLAWPLAWLGSAFVVARMGESDGRWGGLRFRVILLVGAVAFGLLPNLPWWLSLVWLPWLLREKRPAVCLLGVWWLVMAVLTPLYHPYARLWLPLHAASWIMMAGWLAWLREEPRALDDGEPSSSEATGWVPWPGLEPEERSDSVASDRATWFPSRRRLVLIGLAVLLAAGLQFGGEESPLPLPTLLATSDGLHQIASYWNDPGFEPEPPPQSLLVLARPAFRFAYLTTGSPRWPLRIESDWEALRKGLAPGDWVVLDELLLRQEAEDSEGHRFLQHLLEREDGIPDPLSGPTLLDADPSASYGRSSIGEKPGYLRDWHEGQIPRREGTPSARLWLIEGTELQRWIATP